MQDPARDGLADPKAPTLSHWSVHRPKGLIATAHHVSPVIADISPAARATHMSLPAVLLHQALDELMHDAISLDEFVVFVPR